MMTEMRLIDIGELKRSLDEANKMKGEGKLVAMKRLLAIITTVEKGYSLDYTVPWGHLTEIRELLPVVEGSINRLESAKKKKTMIDRVEQEERNG